MSSELWENPTEEPGSKLRRRKQAQANIVPPADPSRQWRPKKTVGPRTWLRFNRSGGTNLVDMGKQSIMRGTGLSARDLRMLDPMLSYPSCITGREGVIVVNLEHVKGIITAQEFWLLNPKDPAVVPFVEVLRKRVRDHYEASGKMNPSAEDTTKHDKRIPVQDSKEGEDEGVNADTEEFRNKYDQDKLKNLPFEFVALETCLEAVCNCLDDEAKSMEKEAYPVLDKLTSKISTRKLDRVRQIKGRLVALSGRVKKVRDLLEHLLEDYDDMAEMYLTKKLLHHETLERASCVSSLTDDEEDDNKEEEEEEEADQNREPKAYERGEAVVAKSRTKHADVVEIEMILEAYFVQAEGALNKLSALKEYVDSTEDYVNIMLDGKQNTMLKMGVVMTTGSLVMNFHVCLTALFAMNIDTGVSSSANPNSYTGFWVITFGGLAAMFLFYIIAIAWFKHKRFL